MIKIISKLGIFSIFLFMYLLNKDYCLIPITSNLNLMPVVPILILIFFILLFQKKIYIQYNIAICYILLFLLGEIGYFFALKYVTLIDVIKFSYFQIVQILTFFTVYSLMFISKNIGKQLKLSLNIILVLNLFIFFYQIPLTIGSRNTSFLGIFYGFDGFPRLMGLIGDPNYFSLYLSMHFYLTIIYDGISKDNKIIILLFILNIIMAFSRAAMISNILILIGIMVLNWEKHKKSLIKLIAICVCLLPFFLEYVSEILNLQEILAYKLDIMNEGSALERMELFFVGQKSAIDYPFGMGIGQQAYFIKEVYGIQKLVHNDFIGVLIEYGILGLFIYLITFYIVYHGNTKLSKIVLLGFIVNLFTLSCYPYILIIAVTTAMLLYTKNMKLKRTENTMDP